jgi:glycosyltransferase involved in cell wall biosynthesis
MKPPLMSNIGNTVSVVVPVFGKARYLEHTLRSVLRQTHQPIELIVVYEGEVPDLERRVKQLSSGAVIIESKQKGVAAARNVGFQNSSGDYLVFLDSDDVLLPRFVERLVETLEADQRCGVACAAFLQIDDAGSMIRRPLRRRFRRGFAVPAILVDQLLGPSTAVCRRDIVEEAGRWPEGVVFEDRAFFVACAQKADFVYVDEPLALYRVHSENRTTLNLDGWLESLVEVSKSAIATLDPSLDVKRLRDDLDAHVQLITGQLHRKAGDKRKALQCALRVLIKRPMWPDPYFLIGRTLLPPVIAVPLRNRIDTVPIDQSVKNIIRDVLAPSWP